MLKVAILDDYQNVAQQFVDLEKLSGKYEFKIFSEPFLDEASSKKGSLKILNSYFPDSFSKSTNC